MYLCVAPDDGLSAPASRDSLHWLLLMSACPFCSIDSAQTVRETETTAAFSRGREFALGIEDVTERFPVYYGLWAGSWVRGEIAQMREPADHEPDE